MGKKLEYPGLIDLTTGTKRGKLQASKSTQAMARGLGVRRQGGMYAEISGIMRR
jgi:hypothetical protein